MRLAQVSGWVCTSRQFDLPRLKKMKYQLAVLGPSRDRFEPALLDELTSRLRELGLSLEIDFEVIHAPEAQRIDWDGFPVAVWLGGEDAAAPDEVDLLQRFLDERMPV